MVHSTNIRFRSIFINRHQIITICMFHIYFLHTLYGFHIRTVLQSLRTVRVPEVIAFVQYSM